MNSLSLITMACKLTASATLTMSVLTSPIAAQQIPIPSFSSTFSVSTATRGFFFQSPTSFVITGVRVPDETMNGTQNVEVFVMQNRPPTFSASAIGGSVFYANNMPSAQVIPTAILVNPGEWVGVLGACGTTTMHSSYSGVGTFPSTVQGMPILLERFLTQTNLNTSGGNQRYSHSATPVSRIEVYTAGTAGLATAIPYGLGCSATGFAPLELGATAGTRPTIGTSYSMELRNIATGSPLAILALGFGRFDPGIQFPRPVRVGCLAFISASVSESALPQGATTLTFPLPIPAGFSNPGLKLYAQAVAFAPPGGPNGLVTSNGLDMTIDIN